MQRRVLLGSAICAILSTRPTRVFAQGEETADVIPPLPSEMAASQSTEPRNLESATEDQQTGTGPASRTQKELAAKIAKNSPRATLPFLVARYFNDISLGKGEGNYRGYMRAWPRTEPANPLIVRFFSETRTVPTGDQTAWCAAFVNWCIARAQEGRSDYARLLKPTRSASSGSFRTWGNSISFGTDGSWSRAPRSGDLIVFALLDNEGDPHPAQGHVGFFVGYKQGVVTVLGGNQFEGNPTVHCINIKRMKALHLSEAKILKQALVSRGSNQAVLAVHSIRTARSLHEIIL